MLTKLDDYPIHQTPEPIAHPATGDRNVYDRYFFHGYSRDGALFFAVALGLYPNRRVMDAAVSVVRDGVQRTVRASRLAPLERTEIAVGPISIEIVEPLRRLRVRVAANPHGIEGELLFDARSAPIEEPRFVRAVDGRTGMDSTRLTQLGAWSGTLQIDGIRIALEPAQVPGARDRSWGVRPVGERETGAPGPLPQFFWLWAPLIFDDVATHFDVNEEADGRRWHAFGALMPLAAPGAALPEASLEAMVHVEHEVRWQPGTRRASEARLRLHRLKGAPLEITLQPMLTFQMLGIGYLHPTWGHGTWHGELAVDGERWVLADLPPLAPQHVHVQQICRATLRGLPDGRVREGLGALEQLVIGPHAPSGLTGLFDGAE